MPIKFLCSKGGHNSETPIDKATDFARRFYFCVAKTCKLYFLFLIVASHSMTNSDVSVSNFKPLIYMRTDKQIMEASSRLAGK